MNLLKKNYFILFVTFVFLTFGPHIAEAQNISLWKVEKDGRTAHIFAAFPFGVKEDTLPVEIFNALEQSNLVIVQTDNSPEAMKTGQATALKNTFMQGKVFSDIISKDTNSKINAYFNKVDTQMVKVISRLRPWAIRATIIMTELAKTNLKPEYSPAMTIGKLIDSDGKIIISLEAPEKQAIRLNSGSDKFQEATLMVSLSEATTGNMSKQLTASYSDWKNGNIESLYKRESFEFQDVILAEKIEPNIINLANKYYIYEPNEVFLPKITDLLNTNDGVFIMLPSIHIGGPKGLLAHLKKNGFKQTQISTE